MDAKKYTLKGDNMKKNENNCIGMGITIWKSSFEKVNRWLYGRKLRFTALLMRRRRSKFENKKRRFPP